MFPQFISWHDFRRFYRTQAYLGSDLWVRFSETHRTCADLTDVTLADEDINSILTANRAIQGNVAMQVTQPGWKMCNKCKWCHLVAKFGTNASGAMLLLNLI